MRIVELFAGTCSFSNVAKSLGHNTFTSDFDSQFNTDYCVDVMKFDTDKVPFKVDILWASPPCETFSIASVSHHWNKDKTPKSEASKAGIDRVLKTFKIIDELKPKYWIIENPRGMLRKMPFMNKDGIYRYTVTYCQYGDTRMKPTDLWSNIPDLKFKPMCKNGDLCHISAPRGSSTGTQGIKTYKDRSRVPEELCKSIIVQFDNLIKDRSE